MTEAANESIIELRNESLVAQFNRLNSQLVSLMYGNREFMWGGGKPEQMKTEKEKHGWQNSGIEMFPIIGRAKDDTVIIDGSKYTMGQHGIARYLPYKVSESGKRRIVFVQSYEANEKLDTPKGTFSFPFSYQLEKMFLLGQDTIGFNFSIENQSDSSLPYAFGFHPAFRLQEGKKSLSANYDSDPLIPVGTHSLYEIQKESETGALKLPDSSMIKLLSDTAKDRFIDTTTVKVIHTFGSTQVWSPREDDYICIEPISAPSLTDRDDGRELSEQPGYRTINPKSAAFYGGIIQLKIH